MDILRDYFWFWVIIGMLFVCVVISLIFIYINKCISRGGKHRIANLHKGYDFNVQSNKYQEKNPKADIPPLPPRTQFLTAEAQSYENLAEVPDNEQSLHDYEESIHDYEQSIHDYEQSMHDYEQSIHDYEQSLDEQPDYVKVEEEETILPPLPYEDPDPDNASTEDYDDIGDGNETQGEEDYDDVA